MSNLLVIDWDYFFYNPLYAVHGKDERFWLFDWGHSENNLFVNVVWPVRGASFLTNGFDLPKVEVPEGWWDRFTITDDAVCELSDSNMYSGACDGSRAFDHVWLYDAHHDLFTIETEEQLAQFAEKGEISCEDWMFAHHLRGSKLHWRWPRWFDYGKNLRKNIPKWVNCDARRDDMGRLDMVFDAVSICRSGAWVPPWCDEQFVQFYQSCPAGEITEVQDVTPRSWEQETQMQIETMKFVMGGAK